MYTSFDKAIAGFIMSIVFIAGYFGLDLTFLGNLAAPIGAVVTAVAVYLMPNKSE